MQNTEQCLSMLQFKEINYICFRFFEQTQGLSRVVACSYHILDKKKVYTNIWLEEKVPAK